jgi:anti-anti-sigma factor
MTDAQKWGLTVARSGGPEAATILLAGRVSHLNAARLKEAFEEAIAAGSREIVVDLGGVDYVSSAGLEVLSRISERLTTSGGHLVLSRARPPVKVALDLAGLQTVG